MGGQTGKLKNDILRRMLEAEQQGYQVGVKELAAYFGRVPSTISEHFAWLAGQGEVSERLRGEWELTTKGRARASGLLHPTPGRIEYRGFIAAGPAIPLSSENLGEYLPTVDLDPAHHFALKVKGRSMVGFGIFDGDMVILRTVTNWLDVPDGSIIAALVPEGTDVEDEGWLDKMAQAAEIEDGAQPPALDHVTLKQYDARLRAFVRQGVEGLRAEARLVGSTGTLRPVAMAVAGIVVRLQREFQ
mgnify:CR=1 FL=1